MQRVLVIEDDDDLRRVVTELLELNGFQVVPLAEFEQAFRLLGEASFDVVVADLSFGGEIGEVRRLRDFRLPVLVCTGCPKARNLPPADLGASQIIMKPFEMDALVEAVRAHAGTGGAAVVSAASSSSSEDRSRAA